MAYPCIIHDDEENVRRDCQRDYDTPRSNSTVLQIAGFGAALLAIGGILHLSGIKHQPRKVRAWRFKARLPPPSSAPTPKQ